ncbi:MAG: M48 family metalloprotease [Candidatus Aenigmarchaeota archaeon]|nr:M48 family metalloprotease [Candidatus Aenigmarchaeota archaeon]
MISELLTGYLSGFQNLLLLIIAWSAAIGAFLQWKRANRAWWIYIHLALVLTPVVDFGTSIQCSMGFSSAVANLCSDYLAKLSLLTLPFVLVGAVLLGFFVIPFLYINKHCAKKVDVPLVNSCAEKAGISVPEVYVFDSQEPKAFTIHKNIFASVGLFDILSEKEQEAVFLHEIGHIILGANWRKFSSVLLKLFSPLAAFAPCQISREETDADAFAVKMQKTSRFINSAKRKIRAYAHTTSLITVREE